jgi:YHS domain-containing protein
VIRLLMWILFGYIAYLIIKGFAAKKEIPKVKPSGDVTHRDPVCGVYVVENDAVVGRHEGERIYFCSMACLEKYQEQVTHKQ